jgi:CheY-like chemotaxis protein
MREPGSILFVEDHERDVELTLGALEQHHLANAVTVVRDGEEALDYLYRRRSFQERPTNDPVLVLLDLKMPKVDGFEVLRQIKSDARLMIPVVVLTSSREEKDLIASYQLGVNAYVVKPVDFEQFVGAVKDLGLFWLVLNEPPPPAGRTDDDSTRG